MVIDAAVDVTTEICRISTKTETGEDLPRAPKTSARPAQPARCEHCGQQRFPDEMELLGCIVCDRPMCIGCAYNCLLEVSNDEECDENLMRRCIKAWAVTTEMIVVTGWSCCTPDGWIEQDEKGNPDEQGIRCGMNT